MVLPSMPADLTQLPRTDPLEIYRYRDGLYAVDLLTAALCEFDFLPGSPPIPWMPVASGSRWDWPSGRSM